jgi:hypothetical protein
MQTDAPPCRAFECMRGLQYRVTGEPAAPHVVINPLMRPMSRSVLPP